MPNNKSHADPSELERLRAENTKLRDALKFYADSEHYHLESDNWDSVSGEPSNILWHSEDPDFIEDGEVARAALSANAPHPVSGDLNPEHTLFNEIRASMPVNEDDEPIRYIITEAQLQSIRSMEFRQHPVSGEQKPLAYIIHGQPGTGEVGLLWDYMPVPAGHTRRINLYREPPAAQDVTGLERAVGLYLAVISDRSSSDIAISAHRVAIAEALAAHRAQQGEHKPSPAFVVSLPVPVKPDEPEEGIDDSWMDGYNGAVRMRAKCVAAIELVGGKVVQGEQSS